MLKKLLELYNITELHVGDIVQPHNMIKGVIKTAAYIRKDQQQMMADYLWLELLEQGRL